MKGELISSENYQKLISKAQKDAEKVLIKSRKEYQEIKAEYYKRRESKIRELAIRIAIAAGLIGFMLVVGAVSPTLELWGY
jgi:hypothetical protein